MTETEDLMSKFAARHSDKSQENESEQLEFLENGKYKPWNSLRINKGRQTRLDLRKSDDTGTIIYYGYIATIEYSGDTHISLIYHGQVIEIRGKYLRGLINALQDERVRYIKEVSTTDQIDPHQPFIEKITFLSPNEEG